MRQRRTRNSQAEKPAAPRTEARIYEDHCIAALREHGFRITMPRVQVIRALGDSPRALSAYAIHEKILEANGKIDVVSVYRILDTLVEVGLIYHVGMADGYVACRILDKEFEGASQLVVLEESGQVVEQPVNADVIKTLEAQVREAGYEPIKIKIEILAK